MRNENNGGQPNKRLKRDLSPTKLSHINAVFWCPPILPLHTICNAQVVMNPGNPCVSTIVHTSTFKFSEEKIPVPPEASYSISEIEWDKATAPPMRVRDILCNYLAGISLENLITLQSKEKWISNTSKQSTVYQIDGLWLRKHQLNNGIYVSQVYYLVIWLSHYKELFMYSRWLCTLE